MSWKITPTFRPVDPFFQNVTLLLHCDGLVDSSSPAKSLTVTGDTQVSSSVKQFGTGSLLFDGSGDSLAAPASVFDPGTNDFTIEWWQKLAATNVSYSIIKLYSNGGIRSGNGFIQFNPANASATNCSASATFSTNWEHVAIVRKSGVINFYHKGDNRPLDAANSAPSGSITSTLFEIGGTAWFGGYSQFNGYIDELRVSVNLARYQLGVGTNAGKMVFANSNELALPSEPFPDW